MFFDRSIFFFSKLIEKNKKEENDAFIEQLSPRRYEI